MKRKGKDNSPTKPSMNNKIIFRTFALCPICVFMEKASTSEFIPSLVMIQPPQNVWYIYMCPKHGQQEVLYCSNISYFYRLLRYSPGLLDPKTNGVGDIEELRNRTSYKSKINNAPFILSLDVLPTDKSENIQERLDFAVNHVGYGKRINKDFLIKLIGKTDDPLQLNEITHRILEHTQRKYAVLLDLPFHKFSRLLNIEKTILLENLIYPCVKIYIEKGREHQNLLELKRLYHTLSIVKNMQSVVQIMVSRPIPDLTEILKLVRTKKGLCRYIIIEYQRTPRFMQNHFKIPSKDPKEHFVKSDMNNLDIYELLRHIEKATSPQPEKPEKQEEEEIEEEEEEEEEEKDKKKKKDEELDLPIIKPSDFYPLSVAMVVEEFLKNFGMGDYNIRPSPLCGVATILVNPPNSLKELNKNKNKNNKNKKKEEKKTGISVPITKYFDIDKLFQTLLPMTKKNSFDSLTLNWFKLKKYKKIIEQAILKNSGLQKRDVLSYLNPLDQEKQKILQEVVKESQILVVHNNVDLACVDVGKRTRCCVGYVKGSGDNITVKSGCMICI